MSSARWMSSDPTDTPPQVLTLAWNHDATCLAVGTTTEFIIYTTEAMRGADGGLIEVVRRPVIGGVSVISVFDKSPVVVFCGDAGETSRTVTLWDDAPASDRLREAPAAGRSLRESCVVAELELSSPVRAIRCHPRVIIVAESFRVWLFNAALVYVAGFPTEHSACTINSIAMATVAKRDQEGGADFLCLRLLLPGPSVGELYCAQYYYEPPASARSATRRPGPHSDHLPGGRPDHAPSIPEFWLDQVTPRPHSNRIRAVAISADGSRGLSVSEKGTAIKVIDVETKTVVRQLMRGVNPNEVRTLALNAAATLAACISETGTLHVFSLAAAAAAGAPLAFSVTGSAQSMQAAVTSWIGGLAPPGFKPLSNAVAAYKSDRAFATFHLGPPDDDVDYNLLGATESGGSSGISEDPSVVAASTMVTHDTFDGSFSCVVIAPGIHNGESHLFVAQGCSGAQRQGRARCMRMSVAHPNSDVKLLSTHLFPKEEM